MGKHNKIKAHTLYDIKDGKLERKNKKCPRCKSFLATDKNRLFCGGCGYSEQKSKSEDKKE
ncbi:MAG: 30S ribosomal protein S27ae [Candidatus Aenigmarchaeota archaeon]|nr:30S ribosomal protein S27ae [Candidatus Aenigmarchaeota archaeon]MCK5321724.1 30S ribosomal protein S27ae [Candidatus Aenigmarchaeota archaeon]